MLILIDFYFLYIDAYVVLIDGYMFDIDGYGDVGICTVMVYELVVSIVYMVLASEKFFRFFILSVFSRCVWMLECRT